MIDSSLFVFNKGKYTAFLLLYVDDIVSACSSNALCEHIISLLKSQYPMYDLVPLNYFLGISVTRTSTHIILSQQKYAHEILERACMGNLSPQPLL